MDWDNFVAGVPGCAELLNTNNTFSCLQSVNTKAILSGLLIAQSEAPEQIPWDPTIDGEGGFIPELPSLLFAKGTFAKIPFISGTNLDEGLQRLRFLPASEFHLCIHPPIFRNILYSTHC